METRKNRRPQVEHPPASSGVESARELVDPAGLAQAEELLNEAFSVLPSASFYDDFPVWDPRHAAPGTTRFGAFKADGKLGSIAGLRITRLTTPMGALAVGLIGAVATAPADRGKGLASACVSAALEKARSEGAAFCLLWGSEHTLYQRLGFELCGVQMRIPLVGLDLAQEESQLDFGIRRGFSPGVFELLKARDGGLVLDKHDFAWFSAHRNVTWYWVGTPERAVACVAMGRGIDLHGLVHEWHGEPAALMALLAHVRSIHPEAALLASPDRVERSGLRAPTDAGLEYLGMGCVLDVAAVVRAFGGELPDGLELEPSKMAQFLFGPGDHTSAFDGKLAVPFPLWIWGLDAC